MNIGNAFILFFLLLLLSYCRKEVLSTENVQVEGAWRVVSPTKYRLIFLGGTLYRDRFDAEGGIDENLEMSYHVSGDTVTVDPAGNLIGRRWLIADLGDTLNVMDITRNAPALANFKLVKY